VTPENIKPYDESRPKTEQVEEMFNAIAPAYDFMNRAMTFGIDKLWRRRAVKMVKALEPCHILDVATGTGDLALQLCRAIKQTTVTGIDLSAHMLQIGAEKVEKAGLSNRITLQKADCLNLPFADNTFDAVTVAYGVRNFEHLDKGYAEMARVLRKGGMLCVIELAVPTGAVVRPFYNLYTRRIIPAIGLMISSDSRAYTYLPESIAAMPGGKQMLNIMEQAGLSNARLTLLTFGTCAIYTAIKP
jgi:demethylmenaquinone methyltransferase/2-methoxy-6-polyprenyl-1,4-benzoquinol methylase